MLPLLFKNEHFIHVWYIEKGEGVWSKFKKRALLYIWTFPIDEKEFQFKNFFLCLSLLLFIVTYIILINMTWALRVKETREFTCLLGTISLNISLTTCHLQHLSLTVHAFLPFVQELHVKTWFRRYVVGLVFVVIKFQNI
jgi:hypothetical protein